MSLGQSIIAQFLIPVISIIIFLIFISVIMSWLVGFNIINLRNPMVRQIYDMLERVTQPILEPIRRMIPPFGGLDFSPIVALLGLSWIQNYLLADVLFRMLG